MGQVVEAFSFLFKEVALFSSNGDSFHLLYKSTITGTYSETLLSTDKELIECCGIWI